MDGQLQWLVVLPASLAVQDSDDADTALQSL